MKRWVFLLLGLYILNCSGMQQPQVILHTVNGDNTFTVEIADSRQERQRGLMNRTQLDNREGMLFIFPALSFSAFWMENTPLSLDIIFIGEDLEIDTIVAETVPYSRDLIRPENAYRYVLEIPAGTAKEIGLKPGDRITLPNTAKP